MESISLVHGINCNPRLHFSFIYTIMALAFYKSWQPFWKFEWNIATIISVAGNLVSLQNILLSKYSSWLRGKVFLRKLLRGKEFNVLKIKKKLLLKLRQLMQYIDLMKEERNAVSQCSYLSLPICCQAIKLLLECHTSNNLLIYSLNVLFVKI